MHDDLEGSQQQEFKLARDARDEDGIAIEAQAGVVIWFHSHLLHKSTENHSQRFRRSYVSHYLSAQAEWTYPKKPGRANLSCVSEGRPLPVKSRRSNEKYCPSRIKTGVFKLNVPSEACRTVLHIGKGSASP